MPSWSMQPLLAEASEGLWGRALSNSGRLIADMTIILSDDELSFVSSKFTLEMFG